MPSIENTITSFWTSEDGAVAVDWVVLTGGLVGLGLATFAVASGGVENLSNDIGQSLANQEVGPQFGVDLLAGWTPGQWDQHNPGIYDSYSQWMTGFDDANLMAHYNNTAQWANMPPNSGHPYDTYHDEFYIARDEAISRGLISPDEPIPSAVN